MNGFELATPGVGVVPHVRNGSRLHRAAHDEEYDVTAPLLRRHGNLASVELPGYVYYLKKYDIFNK